MRFLLIGDGIEEQQWAQALRADSKHSLVLISPNSGSIRGVRAVGDIDAALTDASVEAAILGGPFEIRAEALRRAAGMGLPCICLHPPGASAEPYYQVALTPLETGAVVVPDMPMRLHPAMAEIQSALNEQGIGILRSVGYEAAVAPGSDLVGEVLPQVVDGMRALLGEIESVTATGAPRRELPTEKLTVHMQAQNDRHGEIRLEAFGGSIGPARLTVTGSEGTVLWEHTQNLRNDSRLIKRDQNGQESMLLLAPWSLHSAVLAVFEQAVSGRPHAPSLLDATRSMEIAEGAANSLRRGRTIELHYDEISEASSFKAAMTTLGCAVLLIALGLYVLSRIGLAIGIPGSAYLGWVIIPVLVLYGLLQFLRLAARPARSQAAEGVPLASSDTPRSTTV